MNDQYNYLAAAINKLKNENVRYASNCFFNVRQLQEVCGSSRNSVKITDNHITIIMEEDLFCRLYYYVSSWGAIESVSDFVAGNINKPIVVDVIGKEPRVIQSVSELKRIGFCAHNKLIRMNRQWRNCETKRNDSIRIAVERDIDSIESMLLCEFDMYTSHLPSREHIFKAVIDGNIYLYVNSDEIAALAYFEQIGAGIRYLYQIVVNKNYRGRRIADRLLEYAFQLADEGTKFQLWAEEKNCVAVNKYIQHGFSPDGLLDYILISRG